MFRSWAIQSLREQCGERACGGRGEVNKGINSIKRGGMMPKEKPTGERHNSIAWIVGAAGELQKQVKKLQGENAAFRTENIRLREQIRGEAQLSRVKGKGAAA